MTVTLSGQTWTATTPSTGAVITIGSYSASASLVPVLLGDNVFFSVGTTSQVKWARLIDSSNRILGVSNGTKLIGGTYYAEIPVTSFAGTDVFTNCLIEFMVDLSSSSFTGANYLAEVNFLGKYFDGSTTFGGIMSSVSDYRWAVSSDSSISIYSENYQKTVGALQTLFASTLPITEESKYSISVYNAIRGSVAYPSYVPVATMDSATWDSSVWYYS